MDNIKKLKEIGLKKVSDETHIEQKYLQYMVDCDFEKLNRINTLGFVKILSRAYEVDLSAWSEAFEEYWTETHKDDEYKGLFIVVDDKKQSRKFLIFILIVILIATVSFLFALFENKINLDNYINQSETSFKQSSIVEDTQKTLDEINSSTVENEVAGATEDENQTKAIELVVEVEENTTTQEIQEIEKVEETKELEKIKEPEKIQEIVSEVINPQTVQNSSLRFEKEAIINPNIQLWVGVIYLDNKKRRSYLGEGNFSIDTSREQIITTGHGNLNIVKDGQIKEYKRQEPLRFLVKDNNITEIPLSKFKELNEGQAW